MTVVFAGGEMDAYGVALNWYPNPNMRLMMDYVQSEGDANASTANDEPSIFMLRTQVDF